MKRCGVLYWIIGCWFTVGLVGCATMKEGAKVVAGTSTKELTEARKTAVVKQFNMNVVECKQKTDEILGKIKTYVYARDALLNLTAIYVSYEDTTPVGIFITAVDQVTTKVEVSSPSTYAKDLIAEKLFAGLEGKDATEKKENKDETGQTDDTKVD